MTMVSDVALLNVTELAVPLQARFANANVAPLLKLAPVIVVV